MKLLTTFLLVGLLALWMGFPSEAQKKFPTGQGVCEKPGICPLAECRCPNGITVECSSDNNCPGNQKCCLICCTKKCAPRMTRCLEKAGNLPISLCPYGITVECSSDKDCPGNQKCCLICCTKKCAPRM